MDVLTGFMVVSGFAYCLTKLLLPHLLLLISKAGFERPNYLGKTIPVGGGLIFLISFLPLSMIILGFLTSLQTSQLTFRGLLFLLGMAIMSLMGLLDDVFGNRLVTGLRGHFSKLLRAGEITTGTLKAFAGGLLALGIVLLDTRQFAPDAFKLVNLTMLIMQIIVIILSTNLFNLLDLRPGRASKAFILAIVIISLLTWPWTDQPEIGYLWMVLGSLLAYLPADLQARVMMGDSGSNTLGIALGMVSCWVLSPRVLAVYLVSLLVVHLWAERYSLSKLIAGNAVLCYFDNLGRK